LNAQLNQDVTIRTKGIMEKCTFCVQRIRRNERLAKRDGRELKDQDFTTACAQACPSNVLVFGDFNDPNSLVSKMKQDKRQYTLLEDLGTEPNVLYLKKVDPNAQAEPAQ
jgi:molybdopterin-containing oxidoreductase family iron-sulfur binding subunit